MAIDWHKRVVLVTGAGGFIGSHLAERLVELGADVRAFVHYNALGTHGWLDTSPLASKMTVVAGDVCDRESVRSAMEGVDTVFHLAALIAIPYSYRAPSSYVRTNVEGTMNVVQSARELGVRRVIHTSTSEVYGTARYVPIDEAHPLHGQSPYSATKIGADKIAESYYCSFEVPVVTVRPFNTFGPRQSARAVIPTIVTQVLSGETVRLGALRPTRDFNFVSNTVDGFVAAAESDAAVGETINLGTGREISIGDLAELIERLAGRPLRVETDAQRMRPEASEVERLLADVSKAKRLLNWEPRVTLEDGLQQTIDWIGKHMERYRPGVYVA
ncbi:MAG TPA: SDR family NAD(P)-dependent oxidoreductase [Candidatus Acidoferrales bacterium]|jgi:NAD dependent epimerase/dehydratase|nr:SDR family NAD(P)-dependent oxidoreductase [Candidatus Acidoferrales bacterium]